MQAKIAAALVALGLVGCAAPGANEGLDTEVALCRDVWEDGNSQVHEDACTEVIQRTQSDRLRGEALNYRGLIYSRSGRLELAEADFTEAARLLPNASAPYNNRANVYRKQGRYDLMMADLETAKIAKPGSAISYNNHAYSLCEQGDFAAALPLVEKALELESDGDVEVYDTYGHVLMGLGRAEESEAAFAEAMNLGKSKRVRLYQLALEKKGYAPGRSDGVMDDVTQAALSACIRDNCGLMLD
jgi:tetratricopeptide (TPR) repeat protein